MSRLARVLNWSTTEANLGEFVRFAPDSIGDAADSAHDV